MNEFTSMTKEARIKRVSELRMIALSEILSKDGRVDHNFMLHELQNLKDQPLSLDWFEASIMVRVIGRMRPSRAVGLLGKLRARREKIGQSAEFDKFEEQLRTYLEPMVLTNHGYHARSFDRIEHQGIWDHVSKQLEVLKSEGYNVFLNCGTLLGVVRDKKLIDHDDDIDLGIILEAQNLEDAIAEWIALKEKLAALNLLEKKSPGMPGLYKLCSAGDVEIDLFPAWLQSDKVYSYPHTYGQLTKADLLPLKPCALTGNALPAEPEKMLELTYGKNWTKPDAFFKFPWSSANRKFAKFLSEIQK